MRSQPKVLFIFWIVCVVAAIPAASATAPVAATGQTRCWDELGTLIDCSGTGQDGEYQLGASVDSRFTDNGDGTVADNLTGLIWMKNANCFGTRSWEGALFDANTLADGSCGLTDGSVAGDWRLPNIKELQSLLYYGQASPALPAGHPFSGILSDDYYSSSNAEREPHLAWKMSMRGGWVGGRGKGGIHLVWAVRGGLPNDVATMASPVSVTLGRRVCASGCEFASLRDAVFSTEWGKTIGLDPEVYIENVMLRGALTIRNGFRGAILTGEGTPGFEELSVSGLSKGAFAGEMSEAKVTLCHIPRDNPENAHVIEVAPPAVKAHLTHGDTLGACPDEISQPPAPVAATGQTGCWDHEWSDSWPIECDGTGQDGEFQAGVSVDPRFTDNGDGTVTDNLTGLVWLQYASCSHFSRDWITALSNAKTLANGSCGLTDSSVAGDWRMPNIKELQSLMDYGQASHPALPAGHPFAGVRSTEIYYDYYWSSTTDVDTTRVAWSVDLNIGNVEQSTKIPDVTGFLKRMWVWPVRDGR